MKKQGIFTASIAIAASATVISASYQEELSKFEREKSSSSAQKTSSSSMERFAPRFDGLRFIETLITGHR